MLFHHRMKSTHTLLSRIPRFRTMVSIATTIGVAHASTDPSHQETQISIGAHRYPAAISTTHRSSLQPMQSRTPLRTHGQIITPRRWAVQPTFNTPIPNPDFPAALPQTPLPCQLPLATAAQLPPHQSRRTTPLQKIPALSRLHHASGAVLVCTAPPQNPLLLPPPSTKSPVRNACPTPKSNANTARSSMQS